MIGASVLVVGTKFGAMTDPDGRYIITRLEPGVYVLRITSVDYSTVDVKDIEVKSDFTTEVNQKLGKKVTDLDVKIEVVATADPIQKYETSNQVSITSQAIQKKPVQTVDALLTQVAGVQTNAAGQVFIRGGRANEVSYIVDGVPVGDALGGTGGAGANLSLVSGSIQEIQIIKDGFDPEYGNALSGIVKVTSQTGNKDNTRINMQYMTDDLGTSDLNKYSRNYDFVRGSDLRSGSVLHQEDPPGVRPEFPRRQGIYVLPLRRSGIAQRRVSVRRLRFPRYHARFGARLISSGLFDIPYRREQPILLAGEL